MKYNIIFPTGGFGNHVRLLLLLSSKFNFILSDYGKINTNKLLEKIDVINSYIYTNERTWHNWLTFEFKFKRAFNSQINISHDFPNIKDLDCKFLVLKINPELAYKSYLKFCTFLINGSKKDFFEMIEKHNKIANLVKNKPNFMVINSDILFNEELDFDFYQKITIFFECDNLYETAKIVHKNWYFLHKKAESEIVDYLTNLYAVSQ